MQSTQRDAVELLLRVPREPGVSESRIYGPSSKARRGGGQGGPSEEVSLPLDTCFLTPPPSPFGGPRLVLTPVVSHKTWQRVPGPGRSPKHTGEGKSGARAIRSAIAARFRSMPRR